MITWGLSTLLPSKPTQPVPAWPLAHATRTQIQALEADKARQAQAAEQQAAVDKLATMAAEPPKLWQEAVDLVKAYTSAGAAASLRPWTKAQKRSNAAAVLPPGSRA